MKLAVRIMALASFVIAGVITGAFAEELTLSTESKPVPEGIAAEIAAELGDTVIQLSTAEGPLYEYWFRKEIPLMAKPESNDKALDQIEEITLLGAMVSHKEMRDYRDDELWEDSYTMRFGLQPQDGDHLGTSIYRYFAVLLAAKDDTTLDGFTDMEEMVKVSSDNTAVGHPIIISLRPVKTVDGEHPMLKEPAHEHKSVRVKLTGKVADTGETVDFVMDVVYEGMGEI